MSLLEFVGEEANVLRPSGGCHSCPRKRKDFVPPTLNKGLVLWLGEAPGATEVETGEGFSGAGGRLLREVARKAGVPEPWSFTHVVHCRPPENAKPHPKEIACCLSQFVLDEVRGYPIVVLCGNTALQALFPGAKAAHHRGNVAWHPDFPAQRFYLIDHPGYIIRNPDKKDEFTRQLERLARVIAEKDKPAPWKVWRGKSAVDKLREMVKRPLLSLDFETTSLESWTPGERIRSLAVTADGVDIVAGEESEPTFKTMLDLLAEFVSKPSKSVVGAHVGFDLQWLEATCGVRASCEIIHETGVLWYQAKQYKMPSLKELVATELDGYRYLVWNPHKEKSTSLLVQYNAEDVVHPLHLMKKALPQLRPKTRDLVGRVLGPADLLLQRMTATGFYLRQDYRQDTIAAYQDRRREVITAWKETDPDFIPSKHESGDGLAEYLFKIRGLPILERTESGAASTDASVLKQWVRDGHQFVQHLLDLRAIDKIQSTYLEGYDKHLWPDSRVRSSYPLTWTDSGRSSSRNPNLQNIPRKKEIRDLFGAPPGSVLLEADLSQIEFRIMVCLAKDENGIAGYMRGEDAHTMTARAVSGNPAPTKEQRTNAKPVNFGFLYGAQAFTVQGMVADDYGVIWTDAQSEKFRDTFMRTYPRIPIFHAESKRRLIQNRGWFESVVGHTFHYAEWDAKDAGKRDHTFRSALNAEAQGPAAQLMFYIMLLTRRLLDARGFHTVEFVNTVHDSVLVEIPNPAWVPDVVATMREASTKAYEWVRSWFVVPLILDFKVGESWGSMSDVKD